MKHWFLLLFVALQVQAQEVLFEGHVYDNKTKEPIPYVNLNILKGTSTDNDGHFYIDVQKSLLEKQLHISSLGYNDTIVIAKDIYKTKKFHLIEESFELDEAVVVQSLGDSNVLNPISSSLTSGFSYSSTPWVLALYFPNIGAQKKFVSKVIVFLKKMTILKDQHLNLEYGFMMWMLKQKTQTKIF